MTLNILNYIPEILYRERKCQLPGLGSFELTEKPSFLNVEEKKIFPSSWEIRFNQECENDWERFSDFIAIKENIPHSIAKFQLECEIENLKSIIDIQGVLRIPLVGKISGSCKADKIYLQEYPLNEGRPILKVKPIIFSKSLEPEQLLIPIKMHEEIKSNDKENGFTLFQERLKIKWVFGLFILILLITIGWWQLNSYHIFYQKRVNSSLKQEFRNQLPASFSFDPEKLNYKVVPRKLYNGNAKNSDTIEYSIIIKKFINTRKAKEFFKVMKNWGHKVNLITDSPFILISIPFRTLPIDSSKNLKNLSRVYGGIPKIIFKGRDSP